MKLRTEIHDGRVGEEVFIGGVSAGLVLCSTKQLTHDASAAHALMQAIQNRIRAAEDRCDNTKILAMNGVLNYADEIMHQWGFGGGGGIVSENDETVSLLAAMIAGDRWLSADGCAGFLGGIKRRTFLERVACLPDFPAPAKVVGAGKLWLKSEVDEWTKAQKVSRAA